MKKTITVVLAFLFIFSFSLNAFAANANYVSDGSGILTYNEKEDLNKKISATAEKYGVAFYILTHSDGSENNEYAEDFCNTNGLGENGDSGILSVLDLNSASHMFFTYGDGDKIFTDDDTQRMFDSMLVDYDNQNYYSMYDNLVASVASCVVSYSGNLPGSVGNEGASEQADKYGEGYDFSAPDSNGAYITDEAKLFTDEQKAALLKKAESIMKKYSIDIVLHTTNSIGNKSVQDYADDYYDYNGYGVGDNHDGLMFMLNMNNGEEGNRDYYTSTTGSAIKALTDYAIKDSDSYINSKVLPMLSNGNYYGAFDKYLDLVDIFFAQAATGEPYDNNNPYKSPEDVRNSIIFAEVVVIAVALVIAMLVVKKMKKKMNTAVIQTEAYNYLRPGSTVITNSADVFSHKTVTKIAKPKETSSSSSSGSSTHTSSSGTSHGGGGGKF